MTRHILVVDDDTDVLPVLVEMLVEAGFIVTPADSGLAMRAILAEEGQAVYAWCSIALCRVNQARNWRSTPGACGFQSS